MKRTLGMLVVGGVASLVVALLWSELSPSPSVRAAEPEAKKAAAVAVEPDMHEFMEYVFQPAYKRLQTQMATEPADNQGWKVIKADGLSLAEACNHLLIRQPENDREDWVQHSVRSRDAGGQLYRAAKAKDYKATREHYESMLTNCNACHTQFAEGKHQLKP